MDPDGDGEVTFVEFEQWWKGVEADQLVGDMDEVCSAQRLCVQPDFRQAFRIQLAMNGRVHATCRRRM